MGDNSAAARICVIAPMKNEGGNVITLTEEIFAACAALAPFEVILVNDGSEDDTREKIRSLQTRFCALRLIDHPESCGQSAAVLSGVLAARAPVICTLDGDGQNPPAEIPRLVAPLLAPGSEAVGLVAGQRIARQDTLSKKLASKVANKLRAFLLRDGTRDTGCGLKAFRREAFLRLPYFDHIHRYLPALFRRDGWGIALIDVSHRPRGAGNSNYTNFGRAMVGITDLFGVWWLLRRRRRPAPAEILPPRQSPGGKVNPESGS